MKHDAKLFFLITALLAVLGAPTVHGQQQQAQMPEAQQQAPADAILQLNLSAEQREKIRTIREQTKMERAAIINAFAKRISRSKPHWMRTIPMRRRLSKECAM